MAATDPDRDTLTYRLVDLPGGTDASAFMIDNTGQLKTKDPLDHEMKDSYTVMVTATDADRESDTIEVTIAVH